MAAVSARRMRGPEATSVTRGCGRSASSSAGAKPPSGPTSRPAGPAWDERRRGARVRRRRTGGARRASAAGRAARRQRRGSWIGGTVRRSHCSAASMAMACSRARLTRWALVRAVSTGQQRRHAEFGRLLHDQIGGVALEQRERQPQIGLGACGRSRASTTKLGGAAAQRGDARGPFAVGAVEQHDRVADRAAHHDAEVMRLRRGCDDSAPAASGAVTNRRIDPDMMAGRVAAMAAHTDIIADGWVARLPAGWRPYVLLARLDRPIGAWLLFLPGLWGILLRPAGRCRGVRLVVLFGVGAVVMRVGRLRGERSVGPRYRPPGGAHRRPAAGIRRAAAASGAGVPGGAAGWSGWRSCCNSMCCAWVLGVASLVLVGLYPLAKRVTWWPQLMMGFTFGFGAPLGYAAACWTGRCCAGRAVRRGDPVGSGLRHDLRASGPRGRRAGRRSVPPRGCSASGRAPFLAACYAGAVASLALAGWLAGLSVWFYLALLLPAALLARQVLVLDIDDPALCLRLFQANREVGLAVGAAILLGWV